MYVYHANIRIRAASVEIKCRHDEERVAGYDKFK